MSASRLRFLGSGLRTAVFGLVALGTIALPIALVLLAFNHIGGELKIAFSPDAKTLVSANAGKLFTTRDNLRLWDASSGHQVGSSNEHGYFAYNRSIYSVAYHPRGRILATGGRDEQVIIWDLGPLKKSKVLAANLGSVTTLAFSPDGANLAAGGTLGIIRVWETSSWKEAWSTQAHKATMWPVAALWSLQFSPDSRMLASASNDNTVGLWLPDSSKPGQFARHYQLSGHTSEVTDVAFSPDSSSLASASMDKTVVIWDTKTMRQLRVIAEAATGASVAFSPNGSLLAIGRMDGKTELRDPISGALVRLLEKHDSGLLEKYDSGVMSVAFDRQGQILATASSGFLRRGDIQLWDCGTGGLARTLKP